MIRTAVIIGVMLAQQGDRPVSAYIDGIYLTTGDVTTCPYIVLQAISVNVKAAPLIGDKVQAPEGFPKLGQKARKLGADAVLVVSAGKAHVSLVSWRSTTITGRAVRFTDRTCVPRK